MEKRLTSARPHSAQAFKDGRKLWRWSDADIAKAKKVKAAQKARTKEKAAKMK